MNNARSKAKVGVKSIDRKILATIITACIVVIFAIAILIFTNLANPTTNPTPSRSLRVYNYHGNTEYYIIELRENDMHITENAILNCIQAPCNDRVIGKFTVPYHDGDREFLEQFFQDSSDDYASIDYWHLEPHASTIIKRILTNS